MLLARFFEYKPEGNFTYFSIEHICFIIFGILFAILVGIFVKNLKEEKIKTILKILAILMPFYDIVYWTWEKIVTNTFDFKTSLPLYFCSLVYLVLPFAAFSKNEKVQQTCLAYLATMNLIAGLMGLIFNTHLNAYPMLSFVALRSMFYHISMITISSIIWFSKIYKPNIWHTITFFIPALILFIPACIVNFSLNADYMFLNGGAGTPFEKISSLMPKPIYIIVLMVSIVILINLIFYIPTIIKFLKQKKNNKIKKL